MLKACLICGKPAATGARCAAHRLRSRPRGNAFEPTRQRILERDGYLCQLRLEGCTLHATHVDHVLALSRGGDDSDRNLRAACAHCNLRKGTD